MLTTQPDYGINEDAQLIIFNKQIIGKAVMDVDGYYKFTPTGWADGLEFDAWILRGIADLLDELNQGYDKAVKAKPA